MKMTVEFHMNGAAFADDPGDAAADVLRNVALRIALGATAAPIRDDNGNTIGRFIITDD